MRPWARRLAANLWRAAIAGAVPALTLGQTQNLGPDGLFYAFALPFFIWLAGAYEVDIRSSVAARPRNSGGQGGAGDDRS